MTNRPIKRCDGSCHTCDCMPQEQDAPQAEFCMHNVSLDSNCADCAEQAAAINHQDALNLLQDNLLFPGDR